MDITVVEISSKMVYIARKWYSLEFDDHHRVVIKDGVKFVEGEARKGVKYDAVLVDVCDSSPLLIQPIICPIRTFLGEAFIRNTAKMISTEGLNSYAKITVVLQLTPHFSNYFNYCNIKDTGIGNMIFYCMLKRPLKEKNINVLEFVKNTPL
ncbi:hypothetical protein ANCCAN_02271 [Ancylostoma caninum]|uniref:PABS domain-containing protein n=1 Tax=Ancylostoma caninum TaxID=29170 RepID=A0A368H4V2_ANCCA|nr:hypothetical protein ANCCAN_02271 [Ancylostoma caninum]